MKPGVGLWSFSCFVAITVDTIHGFYFRVNFSLELLALGLLLGLDTQARLLPQRHEARCRGVVVAQSVA
jgi:hypothetical protein